MQRLGVKIAREIVNVTFHFFPLLAKRWIWADADRDRISNPVQHNLSGVNSVRRQQRFDVRKIRRWKANSRAPTRPLTHDARHAVRMSQQLRRLSKGSLADEFANSTG